jgi:rhodanese-related sulfurtransferase
VLKNKGINDVSAMAGGLDAWRSLGFPTETGGK